MALQNPEPKLGARGAQGEGRESGLTSGRCRPDVVHLHDDIHALDHLAEHNMKAVEMGQRDTCDEKLACVRIGACD